MEEIENSKPEEIVYITAKELKEKYHVSRMSLYVWKLQGILIPKEETENGRCTYMYNEKDLKEILRIKNWKGFKQ